MIGSHEILVDGFCGGGGASEGIYRALGRHVDIAINHDASAIAMHAANHPETRHYQESIYAVDPVEACAGRPVGFAWFSPDCTQFSRAKGGKPKAKGIRCLADVVITWAEKVRPRVIMVENVREFLDWGPLDEHDLPIKSRKGETFAEWAGKLRALGYALEWRTLVAADYGAPTMRERLYVIARRDGAPIVWPSATHGAGRIPHRPSTVFLDWSIPRRSIFDRKKPLAEATLRRIATGVRRYVLGGNPYIVGNHAGTMVHIGNGERIGQAPRTYDIRKPLSTVVAQGVKHCFVAALLTKHFGGVVGHGVTRPIGTITAQDHHALTTATLEREGSERVAQFLAEYAPAKQTDLFRHDLVMVGGEPHGISDIGTRMLGPRELFDAQGFGPEYRIDVPVNGKPITKTAQISRAGNAVCPDVACALVEANFSKQQEVAA